MTGQHSQARERAASAAQYALLGGFAAVAAGISAQGLAGFARSNIGLRGPWPYLLFLALDGAAGVCAVLLARRAARAESGLAPRLAAPEAFGLMPVIAAILFEFCENSGCARATRADRTLTTLRWLHPAERVPVQMCMAADEQVSAQTATRHVHVNHAARQLYQLRATLNAQDQPATPDFMATRRVCRAERRAHSALTRAGFADPAIATAVLRQVQVLTVTAVLARLDFTGARLDDQGLIRPGRPRQARTWMAFLPALRPSRPRPPRRCLAAFAFAFAAPGRPGPGLRGVREIPARPPAQRRDLSPQRLDQAAACSTTTASNSGTLAASSAFRAASSSYGGCS